MSRNLQQIKIVNSNYETLLNKDDLEKWTKKLDAVKVFAIDTETDSLDTVSANLVGISLAVEEGSACYIPIGHKYEGCPNQLGLKEVVDVLGTAIEKIIIKLLVKTLNLIYLYCQGMELI